MGGYDLTMTTYEVLSDMNDPRMEKVYGTSLVTYLDASYEQLVDTFGEPTGTGDSYKIDAEWVLIGEDGTVATVYNYKTGPNYLGDGGTPLSQERDWHIGGTGPESKELVLKALEVNA